MEKNASYLDNNTRGGKKKHSTLCESRAFDVIIVVIMSTRRSHVVLMNATARNSCNTQPDEGSLLCSDPHHCGFQKKSLTRKLRSNFFLLFLSRGDDRQSPTAASFCFFNGVPPVTTCSTGLQKRNKNENRR